MSLVRRGKQHFIASNGVHMKTHQTYLSDVEVAARYGVHRTTPWRWAQTDESFPKPVALSPGCTRWKMGELEAWEQMKGLG